ncbi:MAG: NAD(P)/FAD-dependent oxidoreductase [Clostridia bacterium]|nr:NAD(P)/FAD-dependent oxidoreductase [Clostridia bacterium]
MDEIRRIAVVGGGAAGMMAAAVAARNGADVTLFERNEGRLGKKLRITGKGRCNLTNACTTVEFMEAVPRNARFLYAALARFSPDDTQTHFEALGVPLKVERGRRVFPVSDKAADVVAALAADLRQAGVHIVYRRVTEICTEDGAVCGVRTADGTYRFDAVILCTGGVSYPTTGSDGDGHRFARALGHSVTPLLPSLVPIVADDSVCRRLQGLSLKNVALRMIAAESGKTVYDDFGEMMFTHFGLTGPMILSASAHIRDIAPGKYSAVIDLKPALDAKALDARLLADFAKYANRDFLNAMDDLLPQKLIPVIIERSGIDPRKKVNLITREERLALGALLKGFAIPLRGFRPIDEAIITSGGISLKEVDPGSMQSKRIAGLYFAGELLDLDAYTGGYNLQIAFSTAVLAGEHAAWGA